MLTESQLRSKTPKTYTNVEITPELAALFLQLSPGNSRRTRKWWVKRLESLLRKGDFKYIHQAFGFDWDGHFRDGHHRAEAIVKTGIPIVADVAVGRDPDSFKVVDQGIKRTVADVFGLDRRVAEPLRLATRIVFYAQVGPSEIEMLANATKLVECLEELVEFCGATRKTYSCAAMKLAAAAVAHSSSNPSAKTYAFTQYRALVNLDFDDMSNASKAFVKQVESGGKKAVNSVGSEAAYDVFMRGVKIFSIENRSLTKFKAPNATGAATREKLMALLDLEDK